MLERMKEIREDRNYYQKDIADLLNITQVQYSRYETGTRLIPIDKLAKLANFYNFSIDYLVGTTDTRKPYPKSIIKED